MLHCFHIVMVSFVKDCDLLSRWCSYWMTFKVCFKKFQIVMVSYPSSCVHISLVFVAIGCSTWATTNHWMFQSIIWFMSMMLYFSVESVTCYVISQEHHIVYCNGSRNTNDNWVLCPSRCLQVLDFGLILLLPLLFWP